MWNCHAKQNKRRFRMTYWIIDSGKSFVILNEKNRKYFRVIHSHTTERIKQFDQFDMYEIMMNWTSNNQNIEHTWWNRGSHHCNQYNTTYPTFPPKMNIFKCLKLNPVAVGPERIIARTFLQQIVDKHTSIELVTRYCVH